MSVDRERVKALQNPIRAEIYAELRAAAATGIEPTIAAPALADRLNVDHPTIAYHLQVLGQVGLVADDVRGFRSL